MKREGSRGSDVDPLRQSARESEKLLHRLERQTCGRCFCSNHQAPDSSTKSPTQSHRLNGAFTKFLHRVVVEIQSTTVSAGPDSRAQSFAFWSNRVVSGDTADPDRQHAAQECQERQRGNQSVKLQLLHLASSKKGAARDEPGGCTTP